VQGVVKDIGGQKLVIRSFRQLFERELTLHDRTVLGLD
jgi:hypothetical protein